MRVWDAERGVQIGSPLEGHTDWLPSDVANHMSSHALTDAHQVIYGLSYNGCALVDPIKLHEDGWIKGNNNVLLLWIPPALQRPFYSMHTVLVIPKDECTELDLSKMTHGKGWQNCFKGTP
ncbi:hypothetical protein ID866_11546 [Astraeus odoratus]|nr:hypothetical protein ID866_11546 [Astraeus odoratus]